MAPLLLVRPPAAPLAPPPDSWPWPLPRAQCSLKNLHVLSPRTIPAAAAAAIKTRRSFNGLNSGRSSKIRASAGATFPSAPSSSSAPSLSDIVWPSAGAFVSMALMSAVDKWLQPRGLTFLIAPFGAVCCVLFATPNAPAARVRPQKVPALALRTSQWPFTKYNVFMAHVGCALIGVLALTLLGPGWMARSVAVAASMAFMEYTKCLHAPAAGLPLLFIDAPKFHRLQWWYILFPSAAGCILLCIMQEAVKFLKDNAKF